MANVKHEYLASFDYVENPVGMVNELPHIYAQCIALSSETESLGHGFQRMDCVV